MGELGITIITLGRETEINCKNITGVTTLMVALVSRMRTIGLTIAISTETKTSEKSGVTAIVGTMVADSMEMITGATVITVHIRIGSDYTRRDDESRHYRSIHRDTYPGNRDAHRYMDKNRERDEVDYRRESDEYNDNRDNDRSQYRIRDDFDARRYSDSYYNGDSFCERERRYNVQRHSDRFEY